MAAFSFLEIVILPSERRGDLALPLRPLVLQQHNVRIRMPPRQR